MLEADLAGAVRRAFAGTLAEARMRLFHPLGFMLGFAGGDARRGSGAIYREACEGCGADREEAAGKNIDAVVAPLEHDSLAETRSPAIEAFLEDKYDGMRAQVHCGDAGQPGRVAIYSRNREDVTASFPELEEAFAQVRPEQDGALIFDGEILGWDLEQAGRCRLPCWGQRIGQEEGFE